jgi:hypothetical protein
VSTFLGFESLLIALGSTNQNVLDQFRTSLTGYGWQCIRKSVYPVATLGTLGTVANAFDGVPENSSAISNATLPLWIGCQTANPFTPTVMYLQSYTDGTYFPYTFSLDYSDNGSTWTTLQTWTGEPNAIKYYEKRRYAVVGAAPHTYWRMNITARLNGTSTELSEWTLEDASGTQITNAGFIDVIPPITETIGNAWTREFLRISVSGTTIALRPLQELLQPMPMLWAFSGVAGAVTCSITINGVTVSFVGTTGNTVVQNARGLFEACKASTDANFLAYTWQWINFEHHFVAYRTTPVLQASNAITGSNITIYPKGGYCGAPMPQGNSLQIYSGLTMDLTNGFIYYLQVNTRSIALATKTNTGYYGPLHVCYGDNASAVSQLPASFIPGMPVTPIELIVGIDDIATNTGASARISHWWGSSSGGTNNPLNPNATYTSCNMWNGTQLYVNISDMSSSQCNFYSGESNTYGSVGTGRITLRSEGIFTGADSGTGYRIHKLVCDPDTTWTYCSSSSINGRGFAPVFNDLDWYRITGTLTDEQLVVIAGNDLVTTLTGDVLATDVTINVTSTTGFLSTGLIIIEDEAIQYTGITSTSFTGCTRGKYATPAETHYTGSKVNVGVWMVKINTGMLFAGYTKPV